jgi:holo-ACP synthase/triphosphoribosyl-dephospho-CoA synthase
LKGQIGLEDVLRAKEARYAGQVALRERYGLPLVSITINMPGTVKNLPVTRRLCDYALREISGKLDVAASERRNPATGPEALAAVNAAAVHIKELAVKIEEDAAFGRLLDIDVFDESGKLLSRQERGQGRPCFVCGNPAVECMRRRNHSTAEIQQAVQRLLQLFVAWETRTISPEAEKLGAVAVESMLYEVTATPAPGLVDRMNSGAHRDMDFFTFMASTSALSLTMARCAQAGFNHEEALPGLLPVLRSIGQEGETAMFAATNGINTQKGVLFAMGLTVAVVGWLLNQGLTLTQKSIAEASVELAAGLVERELSAAAGKQPEERTAGEQLYVQYGITGIRGEMAKGLPAVHLQAVPAIRKALAEKLTFNEALVQALLVLMTCVEDTTVMHRHDPATLYGWVREEVGRVLTAGGMMTELGGRLVQELDDHFIRKNVSPGGAADLLAVAWFIHRVTEPGFSI